MAAQRKIGTKDHYTRRARREGKAARSYSGRCYRNGGTKRKGGWSNDSSRERYRGCYCYWQCQANRGAVSPNCCGAEAGSFSCCQR